MNIIKNSASWLDLSWFLYEPTQLKQISEKIKHFKNQSNLNILLILQNLPHFQFPIYFSFKFSDAEGRTYLFDLDFDKGQDNPYTVDAAHFGNVAHFINHSCDPSLAVFNVWINCLDPDLPRLALFAVRDIVKGNFKTSWKISGFLWRTESTISMPNWLSKLLKINSSNFAYLTQLQRYFIPIHK